MEEREDTLEETIKIQIADYFRQVCLLKSSLKFDFQTADIQEINGAFFFRPISTDDGVN